MKTATEGQMTEGTVSGLQEPRNLRTAEGEINSLSNTWTNHPNCIRFLKIFSGYQGSWGSFTSDHRVRATRGCFKDPRKTHFSKSFSAQLSLPPRVSDSWSLALHRWERHKNLNHRGKLRGQPLVNTDISSRASQNKCLIRTSLDMGSEKWTKHIAQDNPSQWWTALVTKSWLCQFLSTIT